MTRSVMSLLLVLLSVGPVATATDLGPYGFLPASTNIEDRRSEDGIIDIGRLIKGLLQDEEDDQ